MQIGYARVSTQDQDLSLQYDALPQAQCDKIYEDKASGATASRDGLTLALEVLRETDSLVVWKLDRVGRQPEGPGGHRLRPGAAWRTLQMPDRPD